MAAKKVIITYQDEREPEIVKVLPRAQVMTEAYLGGFQVKNAINATFYMGWAALQTLGKTTLDYETWLNTIDDVEDYEEPQDTDPTHGDPSGGISLSSVSAPESPTAN